LPFRLGQDALKLPASDHSGLIDDQDASPVELGVSLLPRMFP
jgi:hypothetical protein